MYNICFIGCICITILTLIKQSTQGPLTSFLQGFQPCYIVFIRGWSLLSCYGDGSIDMQAQKLLRYMSLTSEQILSADEDKCDMAENSRKS